MVASVDAGSDTTQSTGHSLTSIPSPPVPYHAHPYPLQENFTGRIRERSMLTEWLGTDKPTVLALIAIGGMGKSALTWTWLLQDVLALPLSGLVKDPPVVRDPCGVAKADRPEGVLWWSFYEAEASFTAFVDSALVYASSASIDPATIPTAHDKVRALVDLLQQHRFLIVLDGFERELRAYASLSAAYQGDAVREDRRGDYRACTAPAAASFLRWAAALTMTSRVLLTSRLFPRELDGLAGCKRLDLTALDPRDAVAFFQAQGVRGTHAEIEAACRPYGYHPLALRLLSGMILQDPARPGDVAAAARYSPVEDLVAHEHHILALAYDALSPDLRDLLSRLAAFRSPVDFEVAAVLSPFEGKQALSLAFRELADRGLIFFDQERWRYDLHPVVRAYAYNRLVNKEGVHHRLRDYFAGALTSYAEPANSAEDLAPIIELYHHTVRAGQVDEAVDLFHDRLADPLYFRFGAYQTEIDLLHALFPEGDDGAATSPSESIAGLDPADNVNPASELNPVTLPRVKDKSAQAWILNALASSYGCSGQLRTALPLLHKHNLLQHQLRSRANLAIGLENLAGIQLELGELAAAEQNLRHVIDWARQNREPNLEASSRSELGRLLAYQGAFDQSSAELDVATGIEQKTGLTSAEGMSWIYRAQCSLLRGEPEIALEVAKAALQQAKQAAELPQLAYPVRNRVLACWLVGAAHEALGHPVETEAYMTEALDRCRLIGLVELEPDILLTWARWHQSKGNRKQAWDCGEEALSIADRCEYRLKQAEIHNFLARWELAGGNARKAERHARVAKERAWCDGPPNCYQSALDEAERLIELAGGDEPDA